MAAPDETPTIENPLAPPPPAATPSWDVQRSGFAAEVRDHPAIANFKTSEDLAREHINAQSMIGRKGIPAPKEGDLQDTARWLEDIGRPKTYDTYTEVPISEDDAGAIGWDDELLDGLDQDLFDSGITDQMRTNLLPKTIARFKARQDEFIAGNEAAAAEDMAEMKLRMGGAYESKLNAGRRALQAIFGDNAEYLMNMTMADGVQMCNHVEWVEGLITMGEKHHVDDRLVDSRGRQVDGPMTPEAADAEIKRLNGDKEFMGMYLNEKDIGHEEANKRMDVLYAQKFA